MQKNAVVLFTRVRLFSTISVGLAILTSLIFSDLLGEASMGWQVVVAVIALAIGIPHGALDHLVTLPKAQPKKMALFILVYVAIAIVAVIGILNFNIVGFILVLFMSAVHFGIGDAAYINEMDRRGGRKAKLPRTIYAVAAGATPVMIPLVNSASTDALAQVNPALIDWHQGFDQEILYGVSGFALIAIVTLFMMHRKRESLDIALLLALALIAPPLIAFAVYFGCWHAMRHTARLTSLLPNSESAYLRGRPGQAFAAAVIPGLPALAGTFIFVIVLAGFSQQDLSDKFLWLTLVTIWALTVPHMIVTAKLDRAALKD